MGREVRYDGGHQRDRFVTDSLGKAFELVEVCPEVEAGLSVPRQALRLVRKKDRIRVETSRGGEDMTERLEAWADARAEALASAELDGFVLKRRSPSCGLERVKVYPEGGGPTGHDGVGVFAAALQRRLPWLPLEEDGRLNDPGLRDSFIVRVYAHQRIQALRADPSRGGLVALHEQHKMLLMAHSEVHARELGRLVASAKRWPIEEVVARYAAGFFLALKRPATRRRHTNVLQHLAGHLRRLLDPRDSHELHEAIERYRLAQVPRDVPMTLLRHHVHRHDVPYVRTQLYLHPHPLGFARLEGRA